MTTSSDPDLKELKDLINTRFDKLEERIKALEIGQAKIETRLEEWKPAIQKMPDLIEKVEDTGDDGAYKLPRKPRQTAPQLVRHLKMSVGELKNWRGDKLP